MLSNSETIQSGNADSRGTLTASYVFLVVLAISLVGNVLLGWKVQALRSALTHSVVNKEGQVGQLVGNLQVGSLEGPDLNLTHSGPDSTVIYIFSPDCHWCARNRANVDSLVNQHTPGFQFVGLSVDRQHLKSYLAEKPLPFPVYLYDRDHATSTMGFAGTPQTVVLSPEGKVIHNWIGAYDGAQKEQIETYFKVRLPGLLPEAKGSPKS